MHRLVDSLTHLSGQAAYHQPLTPRLKGHPMKRFAWIGWLIAALLLAQNAAAGWPPRIGANPLEGRLLQQSTGDA